MKKLLFTYFTLLLCAFIYAQAPQSFNYQAVLRDASGAILTDMDVSIDIAILQGSPTGTEVFSETHATTTNAFGQVGLKIGSINTTGMAAIDWSAGPYYLKISMGGTEMGTSQLLSVPFALLATNVENDNVEDDDADATNEIQALSKSNDTIYLTHGGWVVVPQGSGYWLANDDTVYTLKNVGVGTSSPKGKLEVIGEADALPEDPLFEVKRNDGQTVFAVYNEGVRVFFDDEAKGARGGFAVGGFSQNKATNPEYLRVTRDSVRIYINDSISKGARGGFAVGGFSQNKAPGQEFLRVTNDSVRVYVNDVESKGARGGFAVGGFSQNKGPAQEFLRVTNDSIRVYINDEGGKASRGGFAVGGFSQNKAGSDHYFNISTKTDAEIIEPSEPRVLWYPKKEAFLTGKVLVESPDSVGTNSMATGYESKAIGNWSQALGYSCISRGNYSTAIGKNAVADGHNSFAYGNMANAAYNDAFAIGSGAEALAPKSFAFGSVGIDTAGVSTGIPTKASGENAYAIGLGCQALSRGAFAIGANDTASGSFSLAIGDNADATNNHAIAIGYNADASNYHAIAIGEHAEATGFLSVAIGGSTNAIGTASTAMGYISFATGNYSFSAGEGTEAGGRTSTALGAFTDATGDYSTAMGWHSEASGYASAGIGYCANARGLGSTALGTYTGADGDYSTAMGDYTNADGDHSTAMGRMTHADGDYSTAMGLSSIASGSASTAIGMGSKAIGSTSTAMGSYTIARGTRTFAVGNRAIARSAFEVALGQYNDTTNSTNSSTWVWTDVLFCIGNGPNADNRHNAMEVRKNGSVYFDDVYDDLITGSALYINSSGQIGRLSSAARFKKNITDMENVAWLYDLRPVNFQYKELEPEKKQYGLIAEEVEKVNPVFVEYNGDGEIFSVSYDRLITPMLKALQEQNEELTELANENLSLKDEISSFQSENEELKLHIQRLEQRQNEIFSRLEGY